MCPVYLTFIFTVRLLPVVNGASAIYKRFSVQYKAGNQVVNVWPLTLPVIHANQIDQAFTILRPHVRLYLGDRYSFLSTESLQTRLTTMFFYYATV